MTFEYEYKIMIGANSGALVNIESLNSGDFPPPQYPPFIEYPRRELLADGTMRGLGLPRTRFAWAFLTQDQRDALAAYCTDLVSSTVSIEIQDNEAETTYNRYDCIMHWPAEDQLEHITNKIIGFSLDFVNLVDITPPPEPS